MSGSGNPAEVVRGYWAAMNGNDFATVAQRWLSENCRIFWPQSAEIITGRSAFAAINTAYPAQGAWQFDLLFVLTEGDRAVTETRITDGTTTALAITFHRIAAGQIVEQVEYWPDDYPAPAWRAAWVTNGLPDRG